MKLTITLILSIVIATSLCAQTVSHKEKYDSDFMFTDGLYLDKDDFKKNLPIIWPIRLIIVFLQNRTVMFHEERKWLITHLIK